MQKRRRYGKPAAYYIPQQRLIKRLALETGWTEQEVMIQLQKEWEALQKQKTTVLPSLDL